MTLKLHGLAVSNFTNIVKLCLLEKGLEFEEVNRSPVEKTTEFLAISPMGKVPVLETPQGFLSESQAILHYLERHHPEPAVYPSDPMEAGRAQQIHMMIDLYVMPGTMALVPSTFLGAPIDEEVRQARLAEAARGLAAMAPLIAFDPFVAGGKITHADFAALVSLDLTSQIALTLGQPDPTLQWAGMAAYRERMRARPAVARTLVDRDRALAAMSAAKP
jgi:glutathione S-transferase